MRNIHLDILPKKGQWKARRGDNPHPAGPGNRVVHEIAPYQPVLVAESAAVEPVREQKEAGVFDAAGRHHEHSGGYEEIIALQGSDAQAGRGTRRFVGFDFKDIGVQIGIHVGRIPDFFAVHLAEAGGWALLEHGTGERIGAEDGLWAICRFPVFPGIDEGAQL